MNAFAPARLSSLWANLRASFWVVPSAMAGGAAALSFLLIQVDIWLNTRDGGDFGWLSAVGPEGARAILSVIAGSMITVAGLTFSITMLTLQLASSQFGPRVLRNFMRDRGNQVVLGTFIATFLYCLLVLRRVRGTEELHFVPHLAVSVGVLLSVASLGVLIYFIHHVASSIQVESLLSRIAAETRAAIDRLYPEGSGSVPEPCREEPHTRLIPNDFEEGARLVRVRSSGYVQRVSLTTLLEIACEHDLLFRVEARPGRFVCEGAPLVSAYPGDRASEEIAAKVLTSFVVRQNRTPEQDLEFSIRRIVEVAQRSLSPGINDPTTALYCIDRLGEALVRLAGRAVPCPSRFDANGKIRIVTETHSLVELACPAFAAIARYGVTDVDVIARLLATMDLVSRAAPHEARRAVEKLREEILQESREQITLRFDREALQASTGDGPSPA